MFSLLSTQVPVLADVVGWGRWLTLDAASCAVCVYRCITRLNPTCVTHLPACIKFTSASGGGYNYTDTRLGIAVCEKMKCSLHWWQTNSDNENINYFVFKRCILCPQSSFFPIPTNTSSTQKTISPYCFSWNLSLSYCCSLVIFL